MLTAMLKSFGYRIDTAANGHDGLSFLTQQTIRYIPIGQEIELNLGVDPEVVVMDDHSTDRTVEIVRAIAAVEAYLAGQEAPHTQAANR